MAIGSVTNRATPAAARATLSKEAKDMRDAAIGTIPTVLSNAQTKQLGRPSVFVQGTTSGTVRLTYRVKDAATAKALAAAINQGSESLNNNIAESLNNANLVDNASIVAKGNQVIVSLKFSP
jgi:hypothetical protein